MSGFWLLLRKIREEVGFAFIWPIWGIVGVLVNTIRPSPRRVRRLLKADRDRLKVELEAPEALLQRATFYRVTDDGPAAPWFAELLEKDREDRWSWTSARLAYLATVAWDGVDDPAGALAFVHAKDDAYFRYHELNKGENDHWEYYLVPWHRTYGRLVQAMLDERMRPLLRPVWERFDRWYRAERPWMTRVIVGSNIASVLAGYTLHALMGLMLHEDVRERRRYLRDYVTYGKRLRKALDASFDLDDAIATPFEGVLYGAFWLRTVVVLGLVQRALGLRFDLLAEPDLRSLAHYTWRSRTPDGDYHTSGDSRPFHAGHIPSLEVYSVLAAANDDAFARQLVDTTPNPHYLAPKLKPLADPGT